MELLVTGAEGLSASVLCSRVALSHSRWSEQVETGSGLGGGGPPGPHPQPKQGRPNGAQGEVQRKETWGAAEEASALD